MLVLSSFSFTTLSVFPSFLSPLCHFKSFHPFFDHFVTLSVFPSFLWPLCHSVSLSILLFTILSLFSFFPSFFSPLFYFVSLSFLTFTTLSLCQTFHPTFITLSLCQSFHPSFHLFVIFRAAPVPNARKPRSDISKPSVFRQCNNCYLKVRIKTSEYRGSNIRKYYIFVLFY